jgi:hypothetical protein
VLFTYYCVIQDDAPSLHATVRDALPDILGIPSSALHASQSIPKIYKTHSKFDASVYESTNALMHVTCTCAAHEILTDNWIQRFNTLHIQNSVTFSSTDT